MAPRTARRVALALAFAVALTAQCAAQDLYLYSRAALHAGGMREELRAQFGAARLSERALAASSSSDDGPGDAVDLGFSFPTLGFSRLRRVLVDPNGALRMFAHQPAAFPCPDRQWWVLGCYGFRNADAAIGPFVTDLRPAQKRARGASAGVGGVSAVSGADGEGRRVFFAALWEQRRMILAADAQQQNVSVGVALRPDGRVTFMYEALPASPYVRLRELPWHVGSLWAGLRAPGMLAAAASGAALSANDAALRRGWMNSTGELLSSWTYPSYPGFLLNRSDVAPGLRLELCLVPDRDLAKDLALRPLCTVLSSSPAAPGLARVQGAAALFGCLRAGIALQCSFAGLGADGAAFNSSAVLVPGSDAVDCALPPAAVANNTNNATALAAALAVLALDYVDVYSLGGGARRVATQACSAVGGFPLDLLADPEPCPPDALGEPGLRDCRGNCSGPAVLDLNGACCASEAALDCRGICFGAADVTKFRVASSLLVPDAAESQASDQNECCAVPQIDCTGTCGGLCTMCDGNWANTSACAVAQRTRSPAAAPSAWPSNLAARDEQNELPYAFLAVAAALVLLTVTRVASLYLLTDRPPDWVMRQMFDPSNIRAKNKLSPEQLERYTVEIVYGGPGKAAGEAESESGAAGDPESGASAEAAEAAEAASAVSGLTPRSSLAHASVARSLAGLVLGSSTVATAGSGDAGARSSRRRSAHSGVKRESARRADGQAPTGDECAICLCPFESGEVCRKLPCAHLFHADCIVEWFTRSVQCPLCKGDVRGADAPQERRSSRFFSQRALGVATENPLAGGRPPDSTSVSALGAPRV
jgi:hypothetical protein